MSWKIEYTDKWSGEKRVHINRNNESDACGWARSLAEDNNCKAVCTHVADGPYDHSGKEKHVLSVGDNQ